MNLYLLNPDCFLKLEQRSNDFQKKYRQKFNEPISKCSISILTRRDDREIDRISLYLARLETTLIRIDCDCGSISEFWSILPNGALNVSGHETRPMVAWLRHYYSDAINTDNYPAVEATYIKNQTMAYGDTVLELARYVINGNCTAFTRFSQLLSASQVGFTTPKTQITQPYKSQTLIAKPLGTHWIEAKSGTLLGIMPKSLDSYKEDKTEPLPLILQEIIDFDYELRCFVVNQKVICFSIKGCSEASFLWTNEDRISVEIFEPSKKLRRLLLTYCERTKTELCAIDLLVVGEKYVFLECNITFDWLYYEQKAKTAIVTETISLYLKELLHNASSFNGRAF